MKLKVNSKNKGRDITVYVVLRFFVIITMVTQLLRGNYENMFLCILTLVLFMIPSIIDKRLNITLPNALETIILLFIFSAEILGEVQNFYGIFKHWDTMLHTINGFLCAAIGFSLIDILNRSEKFHTKMTPISVALVAFCFSMTVGVLWEFFEYGMDTFFNTDMQKDRIIQTVSSVTLNPEGKNKPVTIRNIDKTTIHYLENGAEKEITIVDVYLDIGIKDTMKDLFVNFIGAVVFCFFGYFYLIHYKKNKFITHFVPVKGRKKLSKSVKRKIEQFQSR